MDDGAATFRTPAENYDRHIGRYGPELAHALAGLAGVGPTDRVLDVGCGPGALTAELVGRAAEVAAVDPSAPFVEACRGRHPGVDVRVASAEELPFADGAFDRVLAQLVVNFMRDAPRGVAEMCRVSRDTVAAAVWDYAGRMTILRRFWDAAVALDPRAEAKDEANMPYCTPEALEALWTGAGLKNVTVEPVTVSAGYSGFEDLWAPLESGVAPSGAYVKALKDSGPFKAEFRRRLAVSDKPFSLTARAFVVVGSRALW